MKILEINLKLKRVKPLTAKQKEYITTIFGGTFIVILMIVSAFSIDTRNKDILTVLNEKSQITLEG